MNLNLWSVVVCDAKGFRVLQYSLAAHARLAFDTACENPDVQCAALYDHDGVFINGYAEWAALSTNARKAIP